MILLERDMQIVAAEEFFWRNMDKVRSTDLTSMYQLSQEFYVAVELMNQANSFHVDKEFIDLVDDDEWTWQIRRLRRMISRCLTQLVKYNTTTGIICRISSDSSYKNVLPSNKFSVKIEFSERLGQNLVKAYLRLIAKNKRWQGANRDTNGSVEEDNSDLNDELDDDQFNFISDHFSDCEETDGPREEQSSVYNQDKQGNSSHEENTQIDRNSLISLVWPVYKQIRLMKLCLDTKENLIDFLDDNTRYWYELFCIFERKLENLPVEEQSPVATGRYAEKCKPIIKNLKHLTESINKPKVVIPKHYLQEPSSRGIIMGLDQKTKTASQTSCVREKLEEKQSSPSLSPMIESLNKVEVQSKSGSQNVELKNRKIIKKKQKTLQQTSNVLISTTNTIRKIYPQITRREFRLSRTVQGPDADSVSATYYSHSNKQSVMSKRVQQRLAMDGTTIGQKSYWSLQVILIICILTAASLYAIILNSYLQTNETFFRMCDSLIKVDAIFRWEVYNSIVDNTMYYMMHYASYAYWSGNPSQRLWDRQEMIVNNYRELIGEKDFINYFVYKNEDATGKYDNRMRTFFKNIQGLEGLDYLRSRLYEPHFMISHYDGKVQPDRSAGPVGLMAFLRYLYLDMKEFKEVIRGLVPLMNGKEFPYLMSQNETEKFNSNRNAALDLSINSLALPLSYSSNNIRQLRATQVDQLSDSLSSNLRDVSIALAVLLVTFIITVFFECKSSVARLYCALNIQSLLTMEEIEVHTQIYSKCLKILNSYKLHEVILTQEYLIANRQGRTKSAFDHRKSQATGKKQSKYAKATASYKKRLRGTELISDKYFSSSIWQVATSSFIFLLVALYYLCMVVYNDKHHSIINLQKLYIDNYLMLVGVNKNIMHNNLAMVYGNFIKIQGEYLEDIPYEDNFKVFIDFWSKNRHNTKTMLSEEDSNEIQALLFGDICDKLKRNENYNRNLYMCKNSIGNDKGLVGFIIRVKQQIDDLRQVEYPKMTDFWNKSRVSRQTQPPLLTNYFSVSYQRSSLLQYTLTDLFIDKLFSIMDSSIVTRIDDLQSSISLIQVLFTCAILLTFVTSLYILIRLLRFNSEVCQESFTNILPEIIFQNQHVLHAFKMHFTN